MTTLRAIHSPPDVETRYPPAEVPTDRTTVDVSTGAEHVRAYRSKNAITSGMFMKPSGSGPS